MTFEGYDRVTEILSPFSGLNHVSTNVLENAQIRGTKVHKACENVVRGIGDWNEDESIQGFIESFKHWWTPDKWPNHRSVSHIESRFKCDDLMITGQVDYIISGITSDGLATDTVIDIKTSSRESKTWSLQGSAYAYLANRNGCNVHKIIFLRLRKEGLPPFVHTYVPNFEMFKKCLEVYRFFYGKKDERKCA